jgi:hypothetical protein
VELPRRIIVELARPGVSDPNHVALAAAILGEKKFRPPDPFFSQHRL